MAEDRVRSLSDFPLGSVWVRLDTTGYNPIVVIDHWTAVKWYPESIDYFVYLCLMSGRTHYCLKGSRDFDELFTRLG